MKKIIFTFLSIAICCISSAQEEKKDREKDRILPKANEQFSSKNYKDAEANYRISRSKAPEKAVAAYNLGNSIYRQNHTAEAKTPYLKAIESAKTYPEKHKAFHNLGNVYMKEKKYQEAVEAYKNALRNNPSDDETRYNFALAKQYLKDNPPPEKDKDKKKKEKEKKEQEEKEKEKKKQEQKEKDEGKGEDKKEEPKNQGQPKPQPGGISKERLENLLEAVNNEEKKIQTKVNNKKPKGRPSKAEKDW